VPEKKSSGVLKTILFVVVFAACAVGGYFGFQKIKEMQDSKNAKDKAAAADSDGGEFGHAKALYDVLDATDPGKIGGRGPGPRRATPPPMASGGAPTSPTQPVAAPTAVVAPIYTLDTNAIKIPESRVNGTISGTNFVSDAARLDVAAGQIILRFYQGALTAPERAILIYLTLKPGEKLAGHNWSISPEMKTPPRIMKMWKAAPAALQPTAKAFSTGYAMDLQLGSIAGGQLSGKIFLALPDTEQSVIAGSFQALTKLPDSAAGSATTTNAAATAAAKR
jgi:hypothetical protein